MFRSHYPFVHMGLLVAVFSCCRLTIAAEVESSKVILINAASVEARTRIEFRDERGQVVSSAEQTVAPIGVATVAVPVSNFSGAARVTADQPVHALVITTDSRGNILDSYESGPPSSAASFALFRRQGSKPTDTSLIVYNVNPENTADVTLRFRDEKGADLGSQTVSLPPLGSHSFNAAIPAQAGKRALAAVLESTRAIVAAERISTKGDGVALRAVTEIEECKTCSLSPVAFGSSGKSRQSTETYIHNRGDAETSVTLTYYDSKGRKKTQQTRSIPAQGLARFDTRKVSKKEGRDFTGYAQVTQTRQAQPLAVQWLVQRHGGTHQMGFNAVASESGSALWICADAPRDSSHKKPRPSKVSLLNPNSSKATATVEQYDATSGQRVELKSTSLPAKSMSVVSLKTQTTQAIGMRFILVRSSTDTPLMVNAQSEDSSGAAGYTCQPIS